MDYSKYLISAFLLCLQAQVILGFKAAVFEHAQQSYATSGTPEDIKRSNLEYYQLAADFAKSKGVELLVFPEYGIIPDISVRKELRKFLEHVPDPNATRSVPCEEPEAYSDRPILLALSCLARKNEMILVANMGDIQPCEGQKGCPPDGVFQFNTNVAFGRDGKILVRYHKEHLFGESGMDVPTGVPQDPTFDTDLGRFATFVCFDIVFRRITEVAHWKGVKAVLLPTYWLNAAPLFNSIQYFESWAVGNDVTLLAANVHLPGNSGLGSVIVKGREGARVYTFNPDGHSKLLIADLSEGSGSSTSSSSSIYVVTRDGIREETEDESDLRAECSSKVLKPVKDVYRDYRCLERSTQNFTLRKLVDRSGRVELCNGGMCCSLDYVAADAVREDFYLGVYNGTYNAMDRYFFPEENCFLTRCDALQNVPCAVFPVRSKTTFYSVHMRANFSTPFIYPSVVGSGMRLAPKSQWRFQSDGKTASIRFKDPSGKNLLTVGMKSRPYDRDPPYVR